MIRIDEFCDYIICKKLFKIGYKEGSNYCITKYSSDYVYDGDPEHSESHKKGDIGIYHFYHKNNTDDNRTYEMPTVYEVQKWLRDKHYMNIYPIFDNLDNKWKYELVCFDNKINNIYYSLNKEKCDNAEDAIRNGINKALRLITKKK